jgi:hypothetical protein
LLWCAWFFLALWWKSEVNINHWLFYVNNLWLIFAAGYEFAVQQREIYDVIMMATSRSAL